MHPLHGCCNSVSMLHFKLFKKEKMKNLLWCLLLCLCAGCNKMLEEDVISPATDDFYNTPAGFQSAVTSSYLGLRSFYATERGMTVSVFGTDTYTNGSD